MEWKIDGKNYRLPEKLTEFQFQMYVHLIDWKWTHITEEPGYYRGTPYDAFFPEGMLDEMYPLSRHIVARAKKLSFKQHKFFHHMASSQAACINLFLPIMSDPVVAATILSAARPDIAKIATEYLDNGFQFELWSAPWQNYGSRGVLNDHTKGAGTDSDFAVTYYDKDGHLCLWLIEHKLTEQGFTRCGGYRSRANRFPANCNSIDAKTVMLNSGSLCYYSAHCGYQYWDFTQEPHFSVQNIAQYPKCPFKEDLNQLWRNQTLARALETAPIQKSFFSVVYHPHNPALGSHLREFEQLAPIRFSHFATNLLVRKAESLDNHAIKEWAKWYRELYYF